MGGRCGRVVVGGRGRVVVGVWGGGVHDVARVREWHHWGNLNKYNLIIWSL